MNAPFEIHTIVSIPFDENTYIVWRPGRTEALVFDPGLQPDLILDLLNDQSLTVAAILNTHGHADHIGGNAMSKETFPECSTLNGCSIRRKARVEETVSPRTMSHDGTRLSAPTWACRRSEKAMRGH